MDKLARMPARDRRDLFSEAAVALGMRTTIIEKDFWVCLVLKILFDDPTLKHSLVFKGGTSLSKVYGLIDRFSEDIDLVLDWQIVGFGKGLKDPMRTFDSNTKQDRFNKEINRIAALYIGETLCPQVNALVQRAAADLAATITRTIPTSLTSAIPPLFPNSTYSPRFASKSDSCFLGSFRFPHRLSVCI